MVGLVRPREPEGPARVPTTLVTDFGELFGDLPVATALLAPDGRFVRVNAAVCRLFGRDEGVLLGQSVLDLSVEAERPAVRAALHELLTGRTQSRHTAEQRVLADGSVMQMLVSRTAVADGAGGVSHLLQQSVERPVDASEAASRLLQTAQSLLQVVDDLADRGHDRPHLAALALDGLTRTVGGSGTVWLLDQDGVSLEAVAVRADRPEAQADLVTLYALAPQRLDVGHFAGLAMAAGDHLLLHEPYADGPASPEFLPWLAEYPVSALLLVPLRHGERIVGVLALARHEPGGTYDDATLGWTRQVTRRLSSALADVSLREIERTGTRRERVLAAVSCSVDEALRRPERMLAEVAATVADELDAPCHLRLVGPAVVHLGERAGAHRDPDVLAALERCLQDGGDDDLVAQALADGSTHRADGTPGLCAVYATRLRARGELLGVLVVGRVTDTFPVDERRLVDLVAQRLSLALDNAALLAETRASQRRHRALVQHSSDLLMLVDADGQVGYASPSVLRLTRAGASRGMFEQVVDDDLEEATARWRTVRSTAGTRPPADVRVHAPDGGVRVLEVVANNLLDDPAVAGVVLTMRDVTRERASSRELQQQADQHAVLASIGSRALTAGTLDELFDHAVHAVNGVLRLGNTGLLELLPDGDLLVRAGTLEGVGVGTTRIPGQAPGIADLLAGREPLVTRDYLHGTASQQDHAHAYGIRSGVLLPVLVDGRTWGVLSCHTTELHDFSGTELDFLQTACTVLAGAVQRSLVEGRVLHQARHDALTGLPNRITLHAALERGLSRPAPTTALLLLDLNDFKDVNDSLGHAAGDRVLSQLGGRLCGVIGERGTVARLGGDEFAVCLDATGSVEEAVAVAEDVLRALQEPFRLPGLDLTLSGSIGVAVAPHHGCEPGRLLQHADLAMYRAKATRAGCAVFDATLDRERSERLALLADLREAVGTAGGLVLHYQPLMDLRSGQVQEVEALVRWRHPERGLLLPDLFVPLAEQTDLIDEITLAVAQESADRALEWYAGGYDVPVACNVSPAALHDPLVVERLGTILAAARGRVSVEITESALVDARARAAIRTLAKSGISCAVDDFGTGYSSLSYLRDLPVDRLKLDRAFNVRVDREPRDATLVAGVVRLAHDLGLHVVAEGVETLGVADVLRGIGVDLAQGWLYGRPQVAQDLDKTAWRRVTGSPDAGP
ncbi:MAG: hypothetical protein JWN08_1669 [Frankiales bacterium]|nr:hypothetical protein [Frankiales bacterium]